MSSFPLNTVTCTDAIQFMKSLPEQSVDLIITDPPYARERLPLYIAIAAEAKRVLKVGKSLIIMCPNFMLPEVLCGMSEHLKYRWLIHYDYWEGSHARMLMGIEVCWKPIAWFVNEKLSPNRPLTDSVRAGERDKSIHIWQQDEDWAAYFIHHLTDEGEVVLDPLIGTGTTAKVAEEMSRQWLGCDHSPSMVNATTTRLEQYHRSKANEMERKRASGDIEESS